MATDTEILNRAFNSFKSGLEASGSFKVTDETRLRKVFLANLEFIIYNDAENSTQSGVSEILDEIYGEDILHCVEEHS